MSKQVSRLYKSTVITLGILILTTEFHFCSTEALDTHHAKNLHRNGVGPEHHRSFYLRKNWPSGVVIYKMSHDFNITEREKIFDAMEAISSSSCIRFQRSSEKKPFHYLYIDRNEGLGCITQTDQRVGKQSMTLDPTWCLEHGRIIHELLHALGFSHEHQRPDRDNFITIKWDNILNEQKEQFIKDDYPMELTRGFHYDLTSVMHYANWSNHAAINPKKPIILPKVKEPNMGQRKGLNKLDVIKINWLYECEPEELTS